MSVSSRLAVLLGLTAALVAPAVAGATPKPAPPAVDRAVAITASAPQSVVTFSPEDPRALLSSTPLSGLERRERIQGIDYRPANRTIYAQSSTGRLFTLDPQTGVLTRVGSATLPFGARASGTDFNPVADRLRSVDAEDTNLRTDVVTPATTVDTPLAYAAGDVNAGRDPSVTAIAYSDNNVGATTTTLYGIDSRTDALVRQAPPNDGTLTTIGSLDEDTGRATGFDISSTTGRALALLTPSWPRPSRLYEVDLRTGATKQLGKVGRQDRYRGLTLIPGAVRFATFNASLNRNAPGQLVGDLSTPDNLQARNSAEIIQRRRPDVVLVNEFDYDPNGTALKLFQDNYLAQGQRGAEAIEYPYAYTAESNTGIASGFDLNNNGQTVTTVGAPGYGDDALGFGAFPGQFGMAVYSKYPIDSAKVRTFQKFLWKDMPGNRLPDDASTPAAQDFYSPEEQAILRLSSKSHWDLPIKIGDETVHLLASHPTPPVFDGPEDRNGKRNADEIRFWADYVNPARAGYIYDDAGGRGGIAEGERFVIEGDQNSDPLDGDSLPGAIQQLLEDPRIDATFVPKSPGGAQQAALQGGANANHRSDPAADTADFFDPNPGNLRADYVLPSAPLAGKRGPRSLAVLGGAVFWPLNTDPEFAPVGVFPFPSTDHRLVFLDLQLR